MKPSEVSGTVPCLPAYILFMCIRHTNKINVMEWPAQSPDLNPIENLWGDIKNVVSEAKPRNAEELWNVVQLSWAGIPVHRCQKLVDSMQHRCEAVLRNSGYTTKYYTRFRFF
uniref:Tc1-like transposase DDE domain-containing protein n=1 Tax=Monopterus albus TaxID=43700 RepID=A0A3Q3JGX1_MONAL